MKGLKIIIPISLILSLLYWWPQKPPEPISTGAMTNSILRLQWEKQLLGDPRTGEIPINVRAAELEFKKNLVEHSSSNRANNRYWSWIGPQNIGGRTRALQYDISDSKIMLAGSASGGIFRTTDEGKSWKKVSSKTQNLAITSIAQDPIFKNIWYACTGEARGGNQISGNSVFSGNGILKSTNGGKSWISLKQFENPNPQSIDSTDRGWRIIVSNINSDVFFASPVGIYRSKDKGITWNKVLGNSGNSGGYSDIIQTKNGTLYAALDAGTFSNYGIHRSTDGTSWTNVGTGIITAPIGRIVLATDQQYNGERIYALAQTANRGKRGEDFRGNGEYHSLYKYTYLSGNGAGSNGKWTNLSANLPVGPEQFDDYISQSAYCMDIAVSSFDSNIVVIGGTNLYISDDGFKSSSNTRFAGGYGEKSKIPDFEIYPNHHPDLQTIIFHPTNKKVIVTGSDGGIHQSDDLYAKNVVWNSLNNNYSSTQFYTLAIDQSKISNRVMGGLQDNGTLLSINGLPNSPWTLPMSYDGGYCSFSNTEDIIYASKQLDGIAKIKIDSKGERSNWKRIDPVTSASYLFINPYLLDPNDNNTMYLPLTGELWWNDKLNDITVDGSFNKQTKDWTRVGLPNGFQSSAIAVTEDSKGTIYLGSSQGSILKVENVKTTPVITNIKNSIPGRGYINSISIDPSNSNRILVVFSNYNTYSVFISENAGTTWQNISGNLEGPPTPGFPAGLEFLNNGPSCRTGIIIPTVNSTYYLIGTSVGLFKTTSLDSMNTKWEAMSPDYIQNNVVSDIKFRNLDSSLWVSTFGGGIYKSYLTNSGFISSVNQQEKANFNFKVYPNPCQKYFSVYPKSSLKNLNYSLLDLQGKMVLGGILLDEEQRIETSQLQRGSYVLRLEQNGAIVHSQTVILN